MVILSRVVILVLDGVGCGGALDAARYGDEGSNTLGNLAKVIGGLALPSLESLGLGHTTAIAGVAPAPNPRGAYGAMREASAGKDTITGHWEMAGLVTVEPLRTFPNGFPPDILARLVKATGYEVLGNKPASGTAIIEELGEEHLRTGKLILYTSADSVLQIAAHEDCVSIPELYRICEAARSIADEEHIGRVIARPFVGRPGAFRRTYNRKDFSMAPPRKTALDALFAAGVPTLGIGKIGDIFSMQGLRENVHTEGNADGLLRTVEALDRTNEGLIFVNLVDFDMLYGHRNDAPGFARCLTAFVAFLPTLEGKLKSGDLVLLTADHGNDPTTPSTDHSREDVPLLAFGPAQAAGKRLGTRRQFCDIAQTVLEVFGLEPWPVGDSFLRTLLA